MQITRQHNQVTQEYSIEEFLQRISGHAVDDNSLLYKACEIAWNIPPDNNFPSSLDVALLLSELGCDEITLTVALLGMPRLIEAADAPDFEKIFGKKIMAMVRNVCQLHAFHSSEIHNTPEQAERLRRMLLSMVEDVRVVLIKLAYRVQRLRQLATSTDDLRYTIARESLDIFAPIANRLGIGQLKWELEDLSFRYLEPQTYKRIANYLDERRGERETYIDSVVEKLKQVVQEAGIQAEIYGRPKHIYSIWKKMSAKHRDFHELYDVRAIRIVVDSVADCYVVLGIVHGLWHHISKEFDDYIAIEKENGYQSLHTAVYGPEGKPLEIQIRTHKMHEFAEHGIAAHWRYKEGTKADVALQKSIDSLRKLLDSEQTRDEELLDNFRAEMFHDRVFILTPEGQVIDLPNGATPLDFAYSVHTEVGHRCRGAKVNGQIVQLTYQLKNGEQVEILTTKQASPSRDWLIPHLGFIVTSRARNRIRAWFRKLDRGQNLIDGKSMYEHELKKQGARPEQDKIIKHFKQNTPDDFYVALGRGDISCAQLSAALHEKLAPEQKEKFPVKSRTVNKTRQNKSGGNINVLGVGNLLTNMANCCKPIPGDEIIGFITQGKGVTIHRVDCSNVLNLKDESRKRLIEVEWGGASVQIYPVSLIIKAVDRHRLLSDITTLLSDEKINVIAVNTLSDKKKQTAKMSVTIEIQDLQQLNRAMDKIGRLPNVTYVSRGAVKN